MTDSDDFLDLDQLYRNCDYINKYCNNNRSEFNQNVALKCNQLIESFRLIDIRVIKELTFEKIPSNGFFLFKRVAISFTSQIVNHIKSKNQLDTKFIKLFDLLFAYRDWFLDTYNILIKEQNNSLMTREFSPSSKACYNVVHSNEEVLRLAFSRYVGFWLSKELQKLLYLFLILIAFAQRLPYSIASIWNQSSLGTYAVKAFKNVDLDYVFNIWHFSEHTLIAKFISYIFNMRVPVKSRTLKIPRQTRFRLDSEGKILDLDHMTKEEIDDYLNDQDEQDRLDAPGKRFRNRENIRCRYSYISSQAKVIESQKRIDERKKSKNFKKLKYYSGRRTPNEVISNESNNQKGDKIKRNNEEFEINICEEDKFLERKSDSKKTLLIYIHGGGFFTQGSRTAEIFLRKICNELSGVPILSIDYSLTVPYPVPNQEILDVYLFVLSGRKEVEDILGFHPEKIVISGDSAGGFFSLSLTITINELNKLIEKTDEFHFRNSNPTSICCEDRLQKYTMPMAIVAAYPVISMENFTLSKTLFTLEPFVEVHLYLLMLSIYGSNMWSIGDFKKIEKTQLFQKIALINRQKIKNGELKIPIEKDIKVENNDFSPWFMTDYETYKNYSDYIATFFNNPFISPTYYGERFKELENVSLFAFVGDQDFLMDDSIELCKRWKGKVHLDIMKGCIHAFLHLGNYSEKFKEAIDLVTERYQEACGLI